MPELRNRMPPCRSWPSNPDRDVHVVHAVIYNRVVLRVRTRRVSCVRRVHAALSGITVRCGGCVGGACTYRGGDKLLDDARRVGGVRLSALTSRNTLKYNKC